MLATTDAHRWRQHAGTRTPMAAALLVVMVGCGHNDDQKSGRPTPPTATAVAPAVPAPGSATDDTIDIAGDQVLARLAAELPDGWGMTAGAQLVIAREAPVWQLDENRINAPVDRRTEAERAHDIQTHGRQIHAGFTYRVEPRWSAERLREVEQQNAATRRSIAGLAAELGIEALRDAHLSSKGGDYFRAKTPDDEEKIAEYQREKARREAQLIALPDCHSEHYSLFLVASAGLESAMASISPAEAAAEVFAVQGTIRAACTSP